MRFETSQHARLSQQMKLAPRMIQAMEILQLPAQELRERLEQELERNPTLELDEPGSADAGGAADEEETATGADGASGAESRRDGEGSSPDASEKPLRVSEDGENFELAREFERNYGDSDDDRAPRVRMRDDGAGDRKLEAMANTPDRAESLAESLQRQWRLAEVDESMQLVGRRLIEYVEEDGLLGADLSTIAAQSDDAPGGPFTVEQLSAALTAAQAFLEPPGILARDRRECLLLQVQARLAGVPEPPDPVDLQAWRDAERLLDKHYSDLLANRIPRIEQESEIDRERIAAAKEILRRLTLNPGAELSNVTERPITPDLVVEYDAERDEYVASLADGTVPSLRVAEQYRRMVKDRAVEKSTRQYLSERLRGAGWLIDAVEQRQAMLLRVAQAVVARQRDWFDQGPELLRPLPMGEIADQLGVHVATISRAVAGKWMSTPRGLVELRRFFGGGLETEGGGSLSFEAVRTRLREIVDAEDRRHPLSDESIAAALREKGISIARRTVVKYREQLGIPAAKLRKQH
ncbi:MAG: RNA polymerase factor sigma-54 [Phycisphaerae bacterium]|nr:RNA polymerase factor sigma-54 [Phycisphaerae bacterium]